jgi:hypothetical protein
VQCAGFFIEPMTLFHAPPGDAIAGDKSL